MVMTRDERLEFWDRYFGPGVYKAEDICGAIMEREAQENTNTSWEVDHIFPEANLKIIGVSQDKIDDDRNLQPLNAANNSSKGKDYPVFKYSVTANVLRRRPIVEPLCIVSLNKIIQLNDLYRNEFASFIWKCTHKSRLTENETNVMNSLKMTGWGEVIKRFKEW